MTKVHSVALVAILVVTCASLHGQSADTDRTLLPEPSGLNEDIFETQTTPTETVSAVDVLGMLENFGTPGKVRYDLNTDGKVDEADLQLLLMQREERE